MGSSQGSKIGLRKSQSKENIKHTSASRLMAKSKELGLSQELKSPSSKSKN